MKIKRFFKIVLSLWLFCLICVLAFYGIIRFSSQKRIVDIDGISDFGSFDCVIVLGCGVNGNKPSGMLEDRLLTGLEVFDNCECDIILMSGDHTTENYNEVDVMKNYAIERGYSTKNIKTDSYGVSTYDSIYRCKNYYNYNKVLIITQEYHLFRALNIARILGLDAFGVKADKHSYVSPIWRNIREILAICKDEIKSVLKLPSEYSKICET